MNQTTGGGSSKLVELYNTMMQAVREVFEETDLTDMSLNQALEEASEKVAELGEATSEEVHEISEYIKRDINDAAEYLMESSADFSDWLLLDIEIVERRIIDLFLSVADKTRVELNQFKLENQERAIYNSGEIAAPGTFECTNCGQLVSIYTTAEIPVCEKCSETRFVRAEKK